MSGIIFKGVDSFSAGSSGPPFPLNSADNGLSVDAVTRRIVLGGDAGTPSQFLSVRQLDINGFFLNWVDPTYAPLDLFGRLDGFGIQFQENISGDGAALGIDPGGGGASLSLSSSGATSFPNILLANTVAGPNNNTVFSVKDSGDFEIAQTSGSPGTMLLANLISRQYQFGDVSGVGGNTLLDIDDNLNTIELASDTGYAPGARAGFSVDGATGTVTLGMVVTGAGDNGTTMAVADQSGFLDFTGPWNNVPGSSILHVDATSQSFEIGDLSSISTGIKFTVDGSLDRFTFNNTAGTPTIQINGVDGFTGTVTPVTSITVVGGIVTAVS